MTPTELAEIFQTMWTQTKVITDEEKHADTAIELTQMYVALTMQGMTQKHTKFGS